MLPIAAGGWFYGHQYNAGPACEHCGGMVRHEHSASLGSIETPQSVAIRVAFWPRVHEPELHRVTGSIPR